MKNILNSKKKAQSLIEYALILAMVAVVAIAALQLLGNNLGTALKNAANTVGTGADSAGENACKAMNSKDSNDFTWENGKCVYSGDSSSSTGD